MNLTIDNSTCKLEGLTVTQYKELREILSYSDSASSYHAGGRPVKRYLLDRKGGFPTGLLYLVEQWTQANPNNTLLEVRDLRTLPRHRKGLFTLNLPYSPYPEQKAAAYACFYHSRGIVSAPTGLGKSVIIALVIEALQVPTLVVVPSLELKRQLSASLKESFGSLDHIRVENVDALDCTKPMPGYDCVIIDEFHRSAAMTYRKLNKVAWGGVYYKYGLTATPFRSNDNERLLLESVLSQVIYKIDYQDAVDNKRIVPVEAFYIDLPVTEIKGNPNSWPAMYSELVVNNEYRNAVIAHLIASLDAPTLTLVKEVAHGDTLATLTGNPFANGLEGNTRMRVLEFNLGETRSLIGTTGVIGEGVDMKPAEYVILAGGGKSKNQFIQNVGRGVRIYPGKESCKIIIFKDKSHKWMLQHFNACVKYLREEYGIKPLKLEIT